MNRSLAQNQLGELIRNGSDADTKKLITDSAYKGYLFNKFNGISGTQVKAGKVFGSSATVDDKSATINVSFKPLWNVFYLQPSMALEAKDGFASIFTNNKYGKTITGGLNFQIFLAKNSSGFSSENRYKLHNQLRAAYTQYLLENRSSTHAFFVKTVDSVIFILKKARTDRFLEDLIREYDSRSIFFNYADTVTLSDVKLYNVYQTLTDTLVKVKLATPDFHTQHIDDQLIYYNDLLTNINTSSLIDKAALKGYLGRTDSLQLNALFNVTHIHWLSGGLSYNHQNYDIADGTSTNLVRTIANEYVVANLAFNNLWSYANGARHYLSVTAYYNNTHNFKADSAITAEQTNNYTIGSTNLNQIRKSYSFYETVPGRLNNIYAEADYIYFNKNINLGFEAAVKGGVNDVEGDNLGLRIGFIVPVGITDNKAILIEPLVRLKELSRNLNKFWENHFVFGFNISVKLPDFL